MSCLRGHHGETARPGHACTDIPRRRHCRTEAPAAGVRPGQLAVRLADTYQSALLSGLTGEETRRYQAPRSAALARWEAAGVVLRLHARQVLPSIVTRKTNAFW